MDVATIDFCSSLRPLITLDYNGLRLGSSMTGRYGQFHLCPFIINGSQRLRYMSELCFEAGTRWLATVLYSMLRVKGFLLKLYLNSIARRLHSKVFVDICYLYRQVLSLRVMLLTS